MQKIFLSAIILSSIVLLSACSPTPQSQAPVANEARRSPSATATTPVSPAPTFTANSYEGSLTPFASIPSTLDSRSAKEVQDLDKLLQDIDTKTYDTKELGDL
jgi:pectin methylesterase-like acyl-CoA thioesterase